jgi:hypothetical protein
MTWTARVAGDLARALAGKDIDAAATAIDDGIGQQAVAAIAATSGPRRALEVALWADRIAARYHAGETKLAFVIGADASDADLEAITDLHARVIERVREREPGQ